MSMLLEGESKRMPSGKGREGLRSLHASSALGAGHDYHWEQGVLSAFRHWQTQPYAPESVEELMSGVIAGL